MASATNKRFTRMATLKSIAPAHLLTFLGRFKEYFADRKVALPTSAESFDSHCSPSNGPPVPGR